MYDVDLGHDLRQKGMRPRESRPTAQGAAQDPQAGRQGLRPLPGPVRPSWPPTLAANATANLARNLWSHSVIMCGHFPEGVETFEQESIDERDQGRVVPPPDARLGQHLRLHGHAPDDRQPVAPDRAPPASPTCRATGTARSPRRWRRCSSATSSTTTPARCRSRSAPPGTRSSGCRCPTAGWRPPRAEPPRAVEAALGDEHQGPEDPSCRPGPAPAAGSQGLGGLTYLCRPRPERSRPHHSPVAHEAGCHRLVVLDRMGGDQVRQTRVGRPEAGSNHSTTRLSRTGSPAAVIDPSSNWSDQAHLPRATARSAGIEHSRYT